MKIVRLALLGASLFLSAFPFMSCSNDSAQATLTLVNNDSSPADTSDLYENQSSQSLGISQCTGSAEAGDGNTCAAVSDSSYAGFWIESTLAGSSLPDSMVLKGFEPGFYWASLLIQRNDPENGCLLSSASGVFEVQQGQNSALTLTLGPPQSCESSSCSGAETSCNGACVDLQTDDNHCGACGTVCDTGQECVAGACALQCADSEADCDGACVDIQTDDNNCGACGNACGTGEACVDGTCTLQCTGGTTDCDGSCVDLATDEENCGACGNACDSDEECTDGTCVAVP